MVYQFIAHKSPGKSKIFALFKSPDDRLEAVTTLGSSDLHPVDDLVDVLNTYLYERKEEDLQQSDLRADRRGASHVGPPRRRNSTLDVDQLW